MPTKVTKAQTAKFDAAKTYSVQVAGVVKIGGLTIRPKQGATIRGTSPSRSASRSFPSNRWSKRACAD